MLTYVLHRLFPGRRLGTRNYFVYLCLADSHQELSNQLYNAMHEVKELFLLYTSIYRPI